MGPDLITFLAQVTERAPAGGRRLDGRTKPWSVARSLWRTSADIAAHLEAYGACGRAYLAFLKAHRGGS